MIDCSLLVAEKCSVDNRETLNYLSLHFNHNIKLISLIATSCIHCFFNQLQTHKIVQQLWTHPQTQQQQQLLLLLLQQLQEQQQLQLQPQLLPSQLALRFANFASQRQDKQHFFWSCTQLLGHEAGLSLVFKEIAFFENKELNPVLHLHQ